jgi:hypothetical protein
MKPGFRLWMLKPKSSESNGCTDIHQTSRKSLNKLRLPESWWKLISRTGKEYWWWNSCNKGQQAYYETLKELCGVIQNKRRGMLTSGAILLHDNALPHTAARTRALLKHFNWELFYHTSWNPDLAPSDYHLFTYLKDWFISQPFTKNEEVIEGVQTWLSSQAAEFVDIGIHKLIPRYKSLNSGGDYVEK